MDSVQDMSVSADIRPALLLVTTRLGGGGAERHLVRLANSLEGKYRVHIAVLRPHGNYEGLVSPTIPIHHLTKGLASRSTLASSQLAVGGMQRLVARLRPCCIISFLEPVFHTVHQAIKRLRDQPPHLVAIQNNPERSLSAFDRRLKRPFLRRIVAAIDGADGVIAISNGVAEAITEILPGVGAKITTINNAAFEQLPRRFIVGSQRSAGKAQRSISADCLWPTDRAERILRLVASIAAGPAWYRCWFVDLGCRPAGGTVARSSRVTRDRRIGQLPGISSRSAAILLLRGPIRAVIMVGRFWQCHRGSDECCNASRFNDLSLWSGRDYSAR